jgi:beta-ureidopropionase / N-carbamoyl-L-amino-acid hydrolase
VACAGSRLLTGVLDPDRARSLTDDGGTTMAEAMAAAGQDPAALGRDDEALRRIGTFLELHVEQGRALDDLGAAVGVAESIWPHGRWRLDLQGRADHTGTTRLADRDDPMLALAAVVLEARDAAERRGALATIGKVRVEPNGVNAIPSAVTAWLDARGPAEDAVRALVADVAQAAGTLPVEESWTPDTLFDPRLRDRLATLLTAPVLPTGAGHDAGILSSAGIPTAMLFVRNPSGISHSPAEHAEAADCSAGIEALARAMEALA